MRTLHNFLSIVLSIGLFTSCGNDWLDLEPSTQIPTETSIKSLSDIDYSLNAIYATMRNAYAYSGRLIYYKPQNKMFHFCKTFCSKITLVNTIQNVI